MTQIRFDDPSLDGRVPGVNTRDDGLTSVERNTLKQSLAAFYLDREIGGQSDDGLLALARRARAEYGATADELGISAAFLDGAPPRARKVLSPERVQELLVEVRQLNDRADVLLGIKPRVSPAKLARQKLVDRMRGISGKSAAQAKTDMKSRYARMGRS
jgi:hypothetical protein